MNRLMTVVALGTLTLCPALKSYAAAHTDARLGRAPAAATRATDHNARLTETVRFADLDITQPSGAAVLYSRLKRAAGHVCRELEPGRDLERMPAYSECVRTALGEAILAVDQPVLTLYAQKRGVVPVGASAIALSH